MNTNVIGKLNIEIDYHNDFIQCEIQPEDSTQKYLKVGNFELQLIIRACYHDWDAQFNFQIFYNNKIEEILIKSKLYRSQPDGLYPSISRFIENTLNQISKLRNIDDIKEFFIINEDDDNDFEALILKMSRIIKLIKKYEDIDPVFPLKTQLKNWIQSKIKTMIEEKSNV